MFHIFIIIIILIIKFLRIFDFAMIIMTIIFYFVAFPIIKITNI